MLFHCQAISDFSPLLNRLWDEEEERQRLVLLSCCLRPSSFEARKQSNYFNNRPSCTSCHPSVPPLFGRCSCHSSYFSTRSVEAKT